MEETYIKITKAQIIFKYEHWGFVLYEIPDEHQEIKELRDKNLTLIYQAPLFAKPVCSTCHWRSYINSRKCNTYQSKRLQKQVLSRVLFVA